MYVCVHEPNHIYTAPHTHSAQLYRVCSAATSGGLALASAPQLRRVVRPGRTVQYKVRVRSTTKTKKQAKPKGSGTGGQAAGPTLNLRIVLPLGARYVKSTTFPPLLVSDTQGRKMKRQPVQEADGLLTWEDIGSPTTHKGRVFKVKVRVDKTAESGTLLSFSAQLFESIPVGGGGNVVPACPRSAPNVTLTVK